MTTKQANEAYARKIAAAEERDRSYAFEVGFIKAAQELGLDREQFATFYQIGQQVLEKQAAAKAK